ncbi:MULTISPECIES: lytic polysaccharide monooxygenase auxiliary activity family 9 protein [Streptomyces]|uniref:lytic polysaccharide monooxygenase auxiliary activity family 9 protein n=1 Tax=Streptomyces TaxID=1883 RepID=UPI0001D067C2|nr:MULTISPECIES: lytic polysaccharide monooxygenase [Streptomyces]MYS43727.1 chitin-binding protein [Streptomyces sp. SID5998]MYX45126.1 chitin-binding protein [Streptomyces sp. SID89]NED72066.1 lytic polysaccharide monooxygenase [Streptomyces sp. SID9944]EFF91208.1 chitin-binding protein [Streptomyces sp. e14]MBY8867222.1 lytic polysaccharide monooxygenase [Streptomyces sennicomposti]
MRTKAKLYAAVLGLTTAGAFVLSTGGASSHGYTDLPISRQLLCANGTVQGCGSIQWEPQSVEGPKGFPASGPADGQICSGNHGEFGALNSPTTPSGGAWPTTKVTGGQSYTFRWQFTARHATTDFKYYVTKQGWNQNHALTRADLNTTPFLTVPYGGKQPPATLSHSGTLPTGLSGHHVILGVWTIADTGNAFYACSDVTF